MVAVGYYFIERSRPDVVGSVVRLDGPYVIVVFGWDPTPLEFRREDIGQYLVCAPTRAQALEEVRRPPETEAQALERVVRQRRVSRVVHFTRLENLRSIAADGALIPRAQLEAQQREFLRTDALRLDGCRTVNLSIEFPNYKMFYPKRMEAGLGDQAWVVLSFAPEILWRLPFRFTHTNAAATGSRANQSLKPPEMFEALYGEHGVRHGERVARHPDLGPAHPTDPQAEALCSERVGLEHLVAVAVSHASVRDSSLFPVSLRDRAIVEPSLFGPRLDYDSWS